VVGLTPCMLLLLLLLLTTAAEDGCMPPQGERQWVRVPRQSPALLLLHVIGWPWGSCSKVCRVPVDRS
jgi:hypothetical protein